MQLTWIAGQAIAFSLTNDASIAEDYSGDESEQAGLTKALGKDFPAAQGGHRLLAAARDGFQNHFAALGRPEVGKWLWRKYAIIAAPLVRLLLLPLDQKVGILAAFNHDVDLAGILRSSDRKVFHIGAIPDGSKAALAIIKDLLVSFYEDVLVGQGIRAEVLGEEEAFDHQEILQSYRRTNLRLKVCPGCDGEPPLRASTRSRQQMGDKPKHLLWLSANVDHFLPKSKYPFLALHPLNLVPLCIVCNQDRKGENDPLEAAGVGDLEDIYHPYLHGAHGEVQVIVERGPNDQQPHLRIRPANDDPHIRARLNSLEHVLGLQDDWDGNLQDERLDPRVEEALRNATQDERYADQRHNDDWLRGKLRIICADLTSSIGKMPHTVPTHAYARWLAEDEQAGGKRLQLLNQALGIEEGVVNPMQRQYRRGVASPLEQSSIASAESPDD